MLLTILDNFFILASENKPMMPELSLLAYIATQIIMESLPISSSGHVLLVQLMSATVPVLPPHFDHFLHGFTILVIVFYFRNAWFSLISKLFFTLKKWATKCSYSQLRWSERQLLTMFVYICGLVIVADCMTALCYGFNYLFLKDVPIMTSPVLLLVGFVMTGVVLVGSVHGFDTFFSSRQASIKKTLTTNGNNPFAPSVLRRRMYRGVILIGLAQGFALLLPGISRFAFTVVAAQWLGMSLRRALQFSFLMFFPLMTAAFLINGIPSILSWPHASQFFTSPFLITYALSTLLAYILFVVAAGAVKQKRLWWFGVYMILPITATVWVMLQK